MKKLMLLLFIFLIGEVFAQVDAPSAYTTNYRIRKYANKARPSADSLNANSDLIDATIKAKVDTVDTNVGKLWKNNTWTGYNTFSDTLNVTGTIIFTGSSGFMSKTGTNTNSATNTFSGSNTFNGNLVVGNSLNLARDNYSFSPGTTPNLIGGIGGMQNIYLTSNATADVSEITGTSLVDGMFLVIINAGSNVVTLLDEITNLSLAGNFAMGQYDSITLIYNSTLGKFIELSRSNN